MTAPRLDRRHRPTTRASDRPVPRPDLRGRHDRLRGAGRLRHAPTTRPCPSSRSTPGRAAGRPDAQHLRPRAGQRHPLRHRPRPGAGRRGDDGRRLRRPLADRPAGPAGRAGRGGRRRVPLHAGRPAGRRALGSRALLSRLAGLVALLVRPGRAPTTPPTRSRPTTRSSSTRSASSPTPASRSGSSWSPRPAGCRLPVAEIPTIWLDRTTGQSNFQLRAWLPRYLRWYRFAFGPPLTPRRQGRSRRRPRSEDCMSTGPRQRFRRVHRRLRRAGAARPRATRSSASTTTPSTARSPTPTTTTPATASSRATRATSS